MIFLICCCCCCLNSIAKSLCAGRERSTCKAQGGFPPKRSRGPGKVSPCKGRSDAAWQGGKQRFGSARAETHQPREGQQVATLPSIAVYCSHSDSRWPGRVQPHLHQLYAVVPTLTMLRIARAHVCWRATAHSMVSP